MLSSAGHAVKKAHLLKFELKGKKIKGWVWKMAFVSRNNVGVFAQYTGDNCYTAYRIKRVAKGLVTAYPHVIVGRKVIFRKLVKGSLWFSVIAFLLPMLFFVIRIVRECCLRKIHGL